MAGTRAWPRTRPIHFVGRCRAVGESQRLGLHPRPVGGLLASATDAIAGVCSEGRRQSPRAPSARPRLGRSDGPGLRPWTIHRVRVCVTDNRPRDGLRFGRFVRVRPSIPAGALDHRPRGPGVAADVRVVDAGLDQAPHSESQRQGQFDESAGACGIPPERLKLHLDAMTLSLERDPFLYSAPFDGDSRRVIETTDLHRRWVCAECLCRLYEGGLVVKCDWVAGLGGPLWVRGGERRSSLYRLLGGRTRRNRRPVPGAQFQKGRQAARRFVAPPRAGAKGSLRVSMCQIASVSFLAISI
jgi:hypothetical protein